MFSKNSFRNIIRVSNSLDPDQARHFVRPNLGPNCLQKLSADNMLIFEYCYMDFISKVPMLPNSITIHIIL